MLLTIAYSQPPGGCASSRGASDDATVNECEVIVPVIAARMKQGRNLTRLRINSGEVWAFAKIAFRASKREVAGVVRAAMLTGNNMRNVETQAGKLLR